MLFFLIWRVNDLGKITSNLFFTIDQYPNRKIISGFEQTIHFCFSLLYLSGCERNRLRTSNIPTYDQLKGIWGATTQLPASLVSESHVCQINRIWATFPQLDIWALQLPQGPHVARNVSLNLRLSQGKEKWQESVWYLRHPMWPPLSHTFVKSQRT